MKLVTAAEMRTIEDRAEAAGVGKATLMENAGLAVAQELWMQLGSLEDRRICVLVGPGNNGGDGLVAARHLHEWGAQVRCYALRPRGDEQWRRTVEAGVACGSVAEDENFEALEAVLQGSEAIIDALLGTGSNRPIEGDLAEILRRLAAIRDRTVRPKLIAVDLPTGLDADSGRLDPLAVAADETVTFHAAKVGLYVQPGAAAAGNVQTIEIGVPAGLDDDIRTEVIERRAMKALLPDRPADAHKGTAGTLLVVAGSANYPGAAILAASAAYRAGAGLVTLAAPASFIHQIAGAMPEVTLLPLPDDAHPGAAGPAAMSLLRDAIQTADALAIGCGLGLAPATGELVANLLGEAALADLQGVVVDADALNHLADQDDWWRNAPSNRAPSNLVLTPHPGEMSRLTDIPTEDLQAQRLTLARDRAAEWNATVVLKGANTVVTAPDGRAAVSQAAEPALATAGTGDVLTSAIGALLAQGLSPFNAAQLAVHLHADAGRRSARSRGTHGATATDIRDNLPLALRSLSGEEPIESPTLPFAGLEGPQPATGLESLFGTPPS